MITFEDKQKYKLQVFSYIKKDWLTIGIYYSYNIDAELISQRQVFQGLDFRKEIL